MFKKGDKVVYIYHDHLYNTKGIVLGKKANSYSTWVCFENVKPDALVINEALELYKQEEY
jgi:hypothetical protein